MKLELISVGRDDEGIFVTIRGAFGLTTWVTSEQAKVLAAALIAAANDEQEKAMAA